MLADLQSLVDRMARADASLVTTEDRDEAIGLAVARYSKDRPRLAVEDVTAAGGIFLALPDGWVEGLSALVELECPIDADPACQITLTDVRLETIPSGRRLRLAVALSAGDLARIRFAAPHLIDDTRDTIPEGDREAVAAYAAAHLLDQLAAGKSGDVDASIGAASVSRATPAQEYAARAKELRRRYMTTLGLNPDRVAPAGAVVSLPTPDSLGRERLLHPRRPR